VYYSYKLPHEKDNTVDRDMQGGVTDKRKINYDFFTAVPGGERLRRRASGRN